MSSGRKTIFGVLIAAATPLLGGAPAHAAPRFLALGDSYTAGTGVTEKQRWVAELVRLIRDARLEIADPDIIARGGWTTGDLLAALDREKPKGPYGLVTLMIGVNNQFRGESLEAYRKDLVTLLGAAAGLAGGEARRVLVVSIPDYSVTPFARDRDPDKIRIAIDRFNGVLREEARRAGAQFVDVTSVSRFAARNPQLVGDDGLHPSWRLHAVWARLIYPAARPALDRLR
jgi:lysophospholipase L1-like esterase